MKHKHAELIKAWADGAEIQRLHLGQWFDCKSPSWAEYYEYRIKPELSDLEKYGVEVGDVWELSSSGVLVTARKIFKASGEVQAEVQSIGKGNFPVARLERILFRRGVVNKL